MSLEKKYLKYKSKYFKLKNNLIGGGNITLPTFRVTSSMLDFIYFGATSGKLQFKQFEQKINDFTIDNHSTITHDNNNIFQYTNMSAIADLFTQQNNDNYLIHSYNNNKIRSINTETYKILVLEHDVLANNKASIYIKANINVFQTHFKVNQQLSDQTNLYPFDIIIKYQNTTLKGKCCFSGPANNYIINIALNNINDVTRFFTIDNNIPYGINNKEDVSTLFSLNTFNFQTFYDNEIKGDATIDGCIQSRILFKNICSSVINMLFISYDMSIIYIYPKLFGLIIKYIIRNYINNINSLCRDNDTRISLLSNILKNINTFQTSNLQIKNSNNEWIDTDSINNCRVIFDTGNSSHTLIGRNIVNNLRLNPIQTFTTSARGVNVNVANTRYNTYVRITLKIKDTVTDFNMNKEFTFMAYIDDNADANILLLGHGSKGLKNFFEQGYCISYNNDINIFTQEYNATITAIDFITRTINESAGDFNNLNTNQKNQILILINNRFTEIKTALLNSDNDFVLLNNLYGLYMRFINHINNNDNNDNIIVELNRLRRNIS